MSVQNMRVDRLFPPDPVEQRGLSNSAGMHWPEYLIEASLLGMFMISACAATSAFQHPSSPLRQAIASPLARRSLIGLAMGLTAAALIYSPLGRRSGAHMNPSLTLTYFRLGKIKLPDAVCYVAAQFAGAIAGVMLVRAVIGMIAADPAVRFAATMPGSHGTSGALAAEFAISFILMTVALRASNSRRFAPFTGALCGLLVAVYITFEAPLSGMSMNPARSLASALAARSWSEIWIYFVAPPLGMLIAGELFVRLHKRHVYCAKLNHGNSGDCIFQCEYHALMEE